jgi:hypothetical protein
MNNENSKTVYFNEKGFVNTNETLELAKEKAVQKKIKNIIISSTTGATGVKASEIFKNHNLIVVTTVTGSKEPNVQRFLPENRKILEEKNIKIITSAHAFGTLGRAVNRKFNAIQVDEIIAHVLRLFSTGVKVACEIACISVDAGYIRTDEDVISIGGYRKGVDTALLLKPSNTHTFFDMRIKEIICKPY